MELIWFLSIKIICVLMFVLIILIPVFFWVLLFVAVPHSGGSGGPNYLSYNLKTFSGWAKATFGLVSILLYVAYLGWSFQLSGVNKDVIHSFFQSWGSYQQESIKEKLLANNTKVVLSNDTGRYILVEINPPKHMYVTLKSLQDNSLHNVYVSKHCNNWRDNKIGDAYNLKTQSYYMTANPNEIQMDFIDLREAFC